MSVNGTDLRRRAQKEISGGTDEHEMLREMVVGIMKVKGCALITKSKLVL